MLLVERRGHVPLVVLLDRNVFNIFHHAYKWIARHRDKDHGPQLNQEARRELALAAAILPNIFASLSIHCAPHIYMYDGSTYGGDV